MKSNEILNEFIEELNKNFDKVYNSVTKYCDIFISNMPEFILKIEDFKFGDCCKLYQHKMIVTKEYHDENCASYKLIRLIEKTMKNQHNFLFWRLKPKVDKIIDFETNRIFFRGMTRFTML